ncbi:MAG: DNA double-strand break repair nuclease NurA [Dehalococcoidia bacterium]
MPPVLRINPWASEYEGALQLGEADDDEAPPAGLRLDVEVKVDQWLPVTPPLTPRPPLIFVDGVRRVEVGVIQEDDGRILYGLFGSYAAGVVVCGPYGAGVDRREVRRRLVVGGGSHHPAIAVGAGSMALEFEGYAVDQNSPKDSLDGLQRLMRELEAQIARDYAAENALAFVDGPLTFLLPLEEPVLGYVKTLYRSYLPDHLLPVLYELQAGQRTPVFAFGEGSAARYSWYLRLAPPRALDYGLAGVVRLEVSTGVGDQEAVRLADLSTAVLPQFASYSPWDARAPQNLFPLGALEDDLHHGLGDHVWVRRAVVGHLLREVRSE